jgi:hypothetical protein
MPRVERPETGEYAAFYAGYIARVKEDDILAVLAAQPDELSKLLAHVNDDGARHRYAPGKWSVRQLVGHLGDGERVFGYRLFCIARGDEGPFPGFDENTYVDAAPFDKVALAALVEDFRIARASNLRFAERLSSDEWARAGVANGSPVSARAIAFVLAGHVRHHVAVLEERYGAALKPPAA